MRTLREVLPLFDTHLAIVAALAVAGTFLCREANLLINLPAELVSIAVIFPLVFSIASAYTRRADALKSFAGLKANVIALYYAHRDWPADPTTLRMQGARPRPRPPAACGRLLQGAS